MLNHSSSDRSYLTIGRLKSLTPLRFQWTNALVRLGSRLRNSRVRLSFLTFLASAIERRQNIGQRPGVNVKACVDSRSVTVDAIQMATNAKHCSRPLLGYDLACVQGGNTR